MKAAADVVAWGAAELRLVNVLSTESVGHLPIVVTYYAASAVALCGILFAVIGAHVYDAPLIVNPLINAWMMPTSLVEVWPNSLPDAGGTTRRPPAVRLPCYCFNTSYDYELSPAALLQTGPFTTRNASCASLSLPALSSVNSRHLYVPTQLFLLDPSDPYNDTRKRNAFVDNVASVTFGLQHGLLVDLRGLNALDEAGVAGRADSSGGMPPPSEAVAGAASMIYPSSDIYFSNGTLFRHVEANLPVHFTVSDALDLAGLSLEAHNTQAAKAFGAPRFRNTGAHLVVTITYTNNRDWRFGWHSTDIAATVSVTVFPMSWGTLPPVIVTAADYDFHGADASDAQYAAYRRAMPFGVVRTGVHISIEQNTQALSQFSPFGFARAMLDLIVLSSFVKLVVRFLLRFGRSRGWWPSAVTTSSWVAARGSGRRGDADVNMSVAAADGTIGAAAANDDGDEEAGGSGRSRRQRVRVEANGDAFDPGGGAMGEALSAPPPPEVVATPPLRSAGHQELAAATPGTGTGATAFLLPADGHRHVSLNDSYCSRSEPLLLNGSAAHTQQ
mgnify:FL=1